jgi:hypothetical protein
VLPLFPVAGTGAWAGGWSRWRVVGGVGAVMCRGGDVTLLVGAVLVLAGPGRPLVGGATAG